MPLAVHGWPRLHLLLGAWAAFGPATFASAATNTPGLSVLLRAASSTTRSGGGRGFPNWISLQIGKIGADDRIYAPYGQRGRVCLEGLDVRRRPLAALVEKLRDDVDAVHFAHERGDREHAGAGTDIKRALLAGKGQQSAQTLPRRCRAAVVLLPDELSRLAEAPPKGI